MTSFKQDLITVLAEMLRVWPFADDEPSFVVVKVAFSADEKVSFYNRTIPLVHILWCISISPPDDSNNQNFPRDPYMEDRSLDWLIGW